MAKGLCRSAQEFWWGVTLAELVDRDIGHYWRGKDMRAEMWRHSAQALTRRPLGFQDFVFPETSILYEESDEAETETGQQADAEQPQERREGPVEDFAAEYRRLTTEPPMTGG